MRKLSLILAFTALLAALPAHAQWTNDPVNGMVTVCDAPWHQWYPRVCNLAGNRTFVGWYDQRTTPYRLYYQVLDPYGNALLADNGVPIVEGDWGTGYEGDGDNDDAVIPDGLGGCIVVFTDNRDGSWDVYGQRLDSLGNQLWGAGGIGLLLWPGPSNQDANAKSFCADSLGNFFCSSIVTYISEFYGLYIQKFRADGTILWGTIGAVVRSPISAASGGEFQETVPDMVGGVIDVWEDYRFSSENATLYFQHLDADGNPLLPLNGIPVRNSSGQVYQGILDHGIPDGQGGGIWARTTAWIDNWFYLFRLNGQGQMLWEWTTGNMSQHGFGNQLLRHPADGTIWFQLYENVPGHHGNFLYRFDIGGTPIFGNRGLPYGAFPMVAASDGIIEGKTEWRGQGAAIRTRMYAQRIDGSGRRSWNVNVALGRASPEGGPCFGQPLAATDGADGAVYVFEDHRYLTQTGNDIAAQRILWNGNLGAPVQALPAAEEPLGKLTFGIAAGNLRYVLPSAGQVKIELFDLLGRRAALILETFQNAGEYAVPFDDGGLCSGIYFLRLTTPAGAQTAKVALVR